MALKLRGVNVAKRHRVGMLFDDPQQAAELEALKAALVGVKGYFNLDEAWALYALVRDSDVGSMLRAVEIGSYKGRSTIAICLALAKRGSGRCISIDPHAPTGKESYTREHGVEDTFDEYIANVQRAGVSTFAKPVRATSETAATHYDGEPIDVLFIDGSHDYEDVALDIKLWSPFLSDEGVIAFNDPYASGVNRAIREFIGNRKTKGGFKHAYHVNNTLFLKQAKKGRGSISLHLYLFVERQQFKLFKLALKGLLEALGLVYRRPAIYD